MISSIRQSFARFQSWAVTAPGFGDAFLLSAAIILITFQPFYLYGELNLLEAGFYLPGIQAVLKGLVPYRDFVHLRGPLELYGQALWIKAGGGHYAMLPTYFYVGGILNMLLFVFIGKELFQSRVFLYLMSVILLTRTFPRVSLTIGGGFRHVWGALAIYCLVLFLKRRNHSWIVLTGICTAIALGTSIEIGVYAMGAVGVALLIDLWQQRERQGWDVRPLLFFILGLGLVLVPLLAYFYSQHALVPMLQMHYQICVNMVKTFPQADPVPGSIGEYIASMLNPGRVNFKHLTPVFCYIGSLVYLGTRISRRHNDVPVVSLAVYGTLMFIGTTRGLWGPGFENAIQPEKVLLFILLERGWIYLKERRLRAVSVLLLMVVFLSTTIYAVGRLQKRFDVVKLAFPKKKKSFEDLVPDFKSDLTVLSLPRMRGMTVPRWQATDMQMLQSFFDGHTRPDEPVLFFPDMGAYHFIVDRPFVGRFPIVALSWISPEWHEEFLQSMLAEQPRYVVTYKSLPKYLVDTQLIVRHNRQKYDEVLSFVRRNYRLMASTPSFEISVRKP